MTLSDKTLPELEQIARRLRQNLLRNPKSKIDRVELEDVEQLIADRKKESKESRSEPSF